MHPALKYLLDRYLEDLADAVAPQCLTLEDVPARINADLPEALRPYVTVTGVAPAEQGWCVSYGWRQTRTRRITYSIDSPYDAFCQGFAWGVGYESAGDYCQDLHKARELVQEVFDAQDAAEESA